MKRNLTYIAYGAGTQSTAMLLASDSGLIERAEVAIFADTGDEPSWVYENLARVSRHVMIPVITVRRPVSLSQSIRNAKDRGERYANIPMFTRLSPSRGLAEGQLWRQCTREFKIDIIEKEVRRRMGYEPRQRIKHRATAMIGISLDEADRMRPSRMGWVDNRYPLTMELGWRRQQCVDYILSKGLPEPGKSSCVFCPYHSDAMWKAMKERHPNEWQKAVEFDAIIRDMSRKGIDAPTYLHRSCVPLAEVNLNENQFDLFAEECEGYCGV